MFNPPLHETYFRNDGVWESNFHGPLKQFFSDFIILVKAESDLSVASLGWDP